MLFGVIFKEHVIAKNIILFTAVDDIIRFFGGSNLTLKSSDLNK